MSDNQFFTRFQALCRRYGSSPNAVGRELGASSGSITAWKRGTLPRASMLNKIAARFGVSVDYLMGEDSASGFTTDDLKFALFGGDKEISDEMLSEVIRFARYIKDRRD